MYNEDEALKEVMEDIKGSTKDKVAVELDFNQDTYDLGMSAKREGKTLVWNNGKHIVLGADYSEGEIQFLQECGYDIAVMVL